MQYPEMPNIYSIRRNTVRHLKMAKSSSQEPTAKSQLINGKDKDPNMQFHFLGNQEIQSF